MVLEAKHPLGIFFVIDFGRKTCMIKKGREQRNKTLPCFPLKYSFTRTHSSLVLEVLTGKLISLCQQRFAFRFPKIIKIVTKVFFALKYMFYQYPENVLQIHFIIRDVISFK